MALKRVNNISGLQNLVIVLQIAFLFAAVQAHVDYSYCKPYTPSSNDLRGYVDQFGRPFVFIGETYSKRYYLMSENVNKTFFEAAFSICARFGLQLATIKTACEYGIVEKWFFSQYPTTYSAWIAGFRFGDSTQPRPLWTTTGEPLDFSQFDMNADYIGGPYPPGGYSPIVYPNINCLSVSRNCPLYTSGPTNPCEQSPTYPDLQFMYLDCNTSTRIICEETSYSKEGLMNEVDVN